MSEKHEIEVRLLSLAQVFYCDNVPLMHPKVSKKLEAFNLRKQGLSYSQIATRTKISKSTLSNWFSNLSWSQSLANKNSETSKSISRKRLIEINIDHSKKHVIRHQRYRDEARAEFASLCQNPLFLVGISIYWGEGSKTNNGRVSVVNADPALLQVVAAFYTKVLHIPREKLRVELFTYEDNHVSVCKAYWAKVLNIPVSQFIKPQVLPSKNTINFSRLEYGFCALYFSNTELSIKILEWIGQLAIQMRE